MPNVSLVSSANFLKTIPRSISTAVSYKNSTNYPAPKPNTIDSVKDTAAQTKEAKKASVEEFYGLRADHPAFKTTLVSYENLEQYPGLKPKIDHIKDTQALFTKRQEAIKKLKTWEIGDTHLTKPEADEYIKNLFTEEDLKAIIEKGDMTCQQWFDLGETIKKQNAQLVQDTQMAEHFISKKIKAIVEEGAQQQKNASLKIAEAQKLHSRVITQDRERMRRVMPFTAEDSARHMEELLSQKELSAAIEQQIQPPQELIAQAQDSSLLSEIKEEGTINAAAQNIKDATSQINHAQEKRFFADIVEIIKNNKEVSIFAAIVTLSVGSVALKNLIDKFKSKSKTKQNHQ